MLPDNISSLFYEALENFEPIYDQPTDSHLAKIREVLAQILIVIPYDKENLIHNLVGLIQDPTTYTADYIIAFARPRKPAIYDASIRDDKKAPVRANNEAIHKAYIRDFANYEAAEHKTGKFILIVIKNT